MKKIQVFDPSLPLRLIRRYALVPRLTDDPVGVERLLQLAANASAKTPTPKEI